MQLSKCPVTSRGVASRQLTRRIAPMRKHIAKALEFPYTNTKGTSMDEACGLFYEEDGTVIRAMCCDYGFRSGSGRLYEEHYGEVPTSVWKVGVENFKHEFDQMRRFFRRSRTSPRIPSANPVSRVFADVGDRARGALSKADEWLESKNVLPPIKDFSVDDKDETPECLEIREKLGKLRLNADKVAAREAAREAKDGKLESPIWVKLPFFALCWVLDVMYDHKPIQKFWVLEVVARIPYFACISILHLYESIGFWRAGAEIRRVHFAEEWNELHHLQIMESLGGDQSWLDRAIAEHAALLYYWTLIIFYLVSPVAAYNFMQRVELHAYDTYCEFAEENEELLRSIPPPMVALNYYRSQDLYMFDAFQKANKDWKPRRPACNNLYDTFVNIRDDEFEHVKTMVSCQNDTIARDLATQRGAPQSLRSPPSTDRQLAQASATPQQAP